MYAIMAPAHESETIVFNFRKLLSAFPNYAELEQILLFSVNWGKQVCKWSTSILICMNNFIANEKIKSCHNFIQIIEKVFYIFI
jgi:hypothetical protein